MHSSDLTKNLEGFLSLLATLESSGDIMNSLNSNEVDITDLHSDANSSKQNDRNLSNTLAAIKKHSVISCQAICSLAEVHKLKQFLVSKGVLKLLVKWIEQCSEKLLLLIQKAEQLQNNAETQELFDLDNHWMRILRHHPMLFELIEQVFCTIASLCKIDRRDSYDYDSEFDRLCSHGMSHNYAIGWIDAQVFYLFRYVCTCFLGQ